jgi:hypothetical protein
MALAGRWWIGPAHTQGTSVWSIIVLNETFPGRNPEVDRLRAMLRQCMPGPMRADLGDGEILYLYLKYFREAVPPAGATPAR